MNYDKEKLKNAILYLAKNGGTDVGKKKLAKFLYFIDFTLYERREKSLTKIDYEKQNYGPMPKPDIFYTELAKLKKEGIIDIKKPTGNDKLEKIVALHDPDLDEFDDMERETLKQIAEKYRLESAGALERIAQSEPPYKMTQHGEIIPYHLAFYRNSFGEMDLNNG